MPTYIKIMGYSDDRPGLFGNSKHRTYEGYVTFDDHRNHKELIKEYFIRYFGDNIDDSDPYAWQVYEPINCATAIVSLTMSEQYRRFEYTSHKYLSESSMPTTKPDKEDQGYKVWIKEISSEEQVTPKSAAWMLYDACHHGKISTLTAQSMVKEKFPNEHFDWRKVLSEFSKYGGRYTAKYLRVE